MLGLVVDLLLLPDGDCDRGDLASDRQACEVWSCSIRYESIEVLAERIVLGVDDSRSRSLEDSFEERAVVDVETSCLSVRLNALPRTIRRPFLMPQWQMPLERH